MSVFDEWREECGICGDRISMGRDSEHGGGICKFKKRNDIKDATSFKFNINNYVKVKLTEKGKNIIENYYSNIPQLENHSRPLPKEDENGWSKWQMWDLMSMFGDKMFNGCDVPFETEIEIPKEYLKP